MKLSTRSNVRTLNVRIVEPTPSPSVLERLQWLPSIAVLAAMAVLGPRLSAAMRLLLASVVLYGAFKIAAAIKQRALWPQVGAEGWLWYATVWPGMDLRPFATRDRKGREAEIGWLRRGLGGIAIGASMIGIAAAADPNDQLGGWMVLAGLLLAVHFGYADVLSWTARRRGFHVRRLFRAPEKATSLNDFWSRRWNRAFVEMDLVLFMPALRRWFGRWAPFAMLATSGLLHELALSYPAGGGWGLPMLYFVGHGLAMQIERTPRFRRLPTTVTVWWTRAWVLAPVSLVFHKPFRDALPLQLLDTLKGLS